MAGYLRQLLAEFLGSFAWVCFGAGAVCADTICAGRLGPVGIALAQGLAVAGAVGMFGRQSAALFNPALTLALAALRRLDPVKAALAFLCQLLGAALGGLFLSALFSHTELSSTPPYLGAAIPSLGFRSATLLEAVLSFFLAVAAHRLLQEKTPERRVDFGAAWAILIGSVAAAGVLVGGPLTGGAMNPARAFGPAVASGYWKMHFVYWVGPTMGSLAGLWASSFLYGR